MRDMHAMRNAVCNCHVEKQRDILSLAYLEMVHYACISGQCSHRPRDWHLWWSLAPQCAIGASPFDVGNQLKGAKGT